MASWSAECRLPAAGSGKASHDSIMWKSRISIPTRCCYIESEISMCFQDAGFRATGTILTSIQGGKKSGGCRCRGSPPCASTDTVACGERVCDRYLRSGRRRICCCSPKSSVRREVTRVLTPGTLDDGTMPAVITFWQLWSLPEPLGFAYADISTGEFFTTQAVI